MDGTDRRCEVCGASAELIGYFAPDEDAVDGIDHPTPPSGTVAVDLCGGCATELHSPGWVYVPIPGGCN